MERYLDKDPRVILRDIHHRWALKVGEHYLRIIECEYYPWDDVFTHRHPRQRQVGTIYVHRSSSKDTSSYKNACFKGMDITINGGLLIRAIRDNGLLIEGPCNVVDYICNKMEWSLQELEEKTEVKRCKWNDMEVMYGARVGLTLKRATDLEEWGRSMILPYRSSIVVPSKHKETFLVTDINREDLRSPSLSKWRSKYEEGKSMKICSTMTLLQVAGYLNK